MSLRFRSANPVLRGAVALTLTAACVAGFGAIASGSVAASPRVHPAASSPNAVSPCAKVVFIGVAGSGQLDKSSDATTTKNMGWDTWSVFNRISARTGYQMTPLGIGYKAASVNVLYPGAQEAALVAASWPLALRLYTTLRVKPYLASINDGVNKTVSALQAIGSACSNYRQIVLAGYSQGAMVIHRALAKLATTPTGKAILTRVVGVILLADGDRVSRSGTGLLGTGGHSASAAAVGIATSLHFNPVGDVTAAVRAKTLSVCDRNDLVCDFRGVSDLSLVTAIRGGRVHTHYLRASAAGPLQVAADLVAKRLHQPTEPPPPPIKVKQLSLGGAHTCGVSTAGAAFCWGENNLGQLGNGSHNDSPIPVVVSGLASGVASISAAENHTCAVTTGGAAWCWGNNGNGQLGDGTGVNSAVPVPVSGLGSGVASVSAGGVHACALTTGHSVWCWGNNYDGELGNGGLATDFLSPVAVSGLGSGVASIDAGWIHTCAVTTAGAAWCWGWNAYGQLGDGHTGDSGVPVPVEGVGSPLTSISAGRYHTCAVTKGGAAECWGAGPLGDGGLANSLVPVSVSGFPSGAAAISAESAHSCVVSTNGAARCWGYNSTGHLGDGTNNDSLVPVAVSALGDQVASIEAGQSDTCAVGKTGAAWCWGYNADGQLGNGTTDNSNVPIAVHSA